MGERMTEERLDAINSAYIGGRPLARMAGEVDDLLAEVLRARAREAELEEALREMTAQAALFNRPTDAVWADLKARTEALLGKDTTKEGA